MTEMTTETKNLVGNTTIISYEDAKQCVGCAHRLLYRHPHGRGFKTITCCNHELNESGGFCLNTLYEKTSDPAVYITNRGLLTNSEIRKERIKEKEEIEIKRRNDFYNEFVKNRKFAMQWETLVDFTLGRILSYTSELRYYLSKGDIVRCVLSDSCPVSYEGALYLDRESYIQFKKDGVLKPTEFPSIGVPIKFNDVVESSFQENE